MKSQKKKTEVLKQGNTGNGVTQSPRSVNISIAQNNRKVNSQTAVFLSAVDRGGLYSLRAAPLPRQCFALCFGFTKALAAQSAPFVLVNELPDTNWLDYRTRGLQYPKRLGVVF